MGVPHNEAHLRLCINRVNTGPGPSVPKLEGSVRCSATGREQAHLPGAPREGFHRRFVRDEDVLGLDGVRQNQRRCFGAGVVLIPDTYAVFVRPQTLAAVRSSKRSISGISIVPKLVFSMF